MRLTARPLVWCVGLLLIGLGLYWLWFQGGLQALSLPIVTWQRDFHRALTLAIT